MTSSPFLQYSQINPLARQSCVEFREGVEKNNKENIMPRQWQSSDKLL